jgi:hypothetical protein
MVPASAEQLSVPPDLSAGQWLFSASELLGSRGGDGNLAGGERLDRGLRVQHPVQARRHRPADQRRDYEQPYLARAVPPTMSAGPRLRAGFTEVPVMGIPMRWTTVRENR